MPNEVIIKVKVDDGQTKAGYDRARRKAQEYGSQVEDDLKVSGVKAGRAQGQSVGNSLNAELRSLRLPEIDVKANVTEALVKLDEARHSAEELGKDNPSVEVKVHTEKAMLEIDRLKAKLRSVGDGAGEEAGGGFIKQFAAKIGAAAPSAATIIAPIGAAMAPLLAGSIAAAVVGGVGLGGIAGGFALAARDPDVQLAILDLGDTLNTQLTEAAAPFYKVTIDSISRIKMALTGINFKGIFADLAPQVGPIVNGITILIDKIGGAIENIAKKSGPVITEIGHELGQFGTILANGLDSLANHSSQEAQALHDLFAIINGGVTVAFDLVAALTEVYGVFHKMEQISLIGIYETFNDKQVKIAGTAREMAQSILDSVKATDQEATSAETAADALKAQDDAIHAVSNSLKAATDPAFAFIDAQSTLVDKQTAYNKAVKTGGENSSGARKAQLDLQKAMVNYVSAAANATNGTGHLTAEQKNLLRSAGTSKKGIQDLDTALYNAWKQANKLDGFEIDVTYKTTFKTYGRPISGPIDPATFYHGMAHGGVAGAASGATSSGLTWVGENGPELANLPPGTAVHTAGDSARMAQKAGGGESSQPFIVQLMVDGKRLAEATIDPMRRIVWQDFGGSVQAAYGKG